MGRQSLKKRADRKHLNPAQATKLRAEAIDKMPKKLAMKFNLIERQVNDLRSENLRYYHKIGQLVLDIRQNPQDYVGRDGTAGMKLIEDALSTQSRLLRRTASFAELYTTADLNRLISMVNDETQFRLHWGHVAFLLTVPDKEKREEFAMEAVQKMLDPDALHALIKKQTGRKGGHGRGHTVPATVPAQVRQVRKTSKTWADKNESVWAGEKINVFNNVLNLPPEQMTPELLDDLKESRTLMERVSQAAADNVETLGRVIEHVEGCLKKQAAAAKEDAEAAAKNERRPRHIDLGRKNGKQTAA